MKMVRMFIVSLLIFGTLLFADEQDSFKLAAPADWSGESIPLPPGFAPDMKLKGSEHIRFAPGMMNPESESFFCYAFAFELQSQPVLTEDIIKEEFLKYYRGMCKAVLNGTLPKVDPSQFTLELQRMKSDAQVLQNEHRTDSPTEYIGTLDWIEPFVTKKPQKLNLEIRTWASSDSNYIFVCASPQTRDAAIWKQLHTIRDDYLKE
jgi:hypothetical protein